MAAFFLFFLGIGREEGKDKVVEEKKNERNQSSGSFQTLFTCCDRVKNLKVINLWQSYVKLCDFPKVALYLFTFLVLASYL